MFTRKNQPETAQETASIATGKGFMAELDEWLDRSVFEPIEHAIENGDTKELHLAFSESKQLLKRKVLASYHNGLEARPQQTINQNNYEPRQRNYRRN
jgi:hypothetical protein